MSVLEPYVAGMTWGWTGIRGTWSAPEATESIALMAEHGVNWTAVTFAVEQETAQSTELSWDLAPTVSEDEIRWAIRESKSRGLRVCLKPVVNVADGTWRAYIGFFDWDVPGEPNWSQWFASYTEYIVAMARIAQEEQCEMLCIGCEMVRSDGREAEWRALIVEVRAVYDGFVVYNCDKYQEDKISWWDAVDAVASSGYYPVDRWDQELDRIEAVVESTGKPFFFMEAGCPSRVGSAAKPNDWNLPGGPSGREQLEYFQAMFKACEKRDWMRGFMLWDWPAALYLAEDASKNDDYCPYGKPAADYMRRVYQGKAQGTEYTL